MWRRGWFFPEKDFCVWAFQPCWPSFRKPRFTRFKMMSCRPCVLARRSFCWFSWAVRKCPASGWEPPPGLALAATFLTKFSNLPLLVVAALFIGFKIRQLTRAGTLRAAGPALLALALCAGLPMLGWLAWCKYNFGDFTGTAAKIQLLGWTHKPFGEWWHHPDLHAAGFGTFISKLMARFWRGEFLWHGQALASPVVDAIYAISSVGLVVLALAGLRPQSACN
jgi:hypothetical protein